MASPKKFSKKTKIRVGLVFGGKSGEHEVSLQSAKSIYNAIDKSKYDVTLIGIDKRGQWHLGQGSNFLLNSENPKLIRLNKTAPQVLPVPANSGKPAAIRAHQSNKDLASIDVFFPIIHGTYGEDGSLQGLFEMLDTAYVGAGVLGSAVGMDKAIMKRLWHSVGLPVAPYAAIKRMHKKTEIEKLANNLGLKNGNPVFIKPANLGSSVGVAKVSNLKQLHISIEQAFEYDNKVLIEEFVEGREIECSVLGNDQPTASMPGEVNPTHDFYSYKAKYIDENGAELHIPAKLSKQTIKAVQKLAISAFTSLDCLGMARVDMFLKPDGKLVLNEINTLPGFTKISMYPKLWEASGLSYTKLLDKLVTLAFEVKQNKAKLKRDFDIS